MNSPLKPNSDDLGTTWGSHPSKKSIFRPHEEFHCLDSLRCCFMDDFGFSSGKKMPRKLLISYLQFSDVSCVSQRLPRRWWLLLRQRKAVPVQRARSVPVHETYAGLQLVHTTISVDADVWTPQEPVWSDKGNLWHRESGKMTTTIVLRVDRGLFLRLWGFFAFEFARTA